MVKKKVSKKKLTRNKKPLKKNVSKLAKTKRKKKVLAVPKGYQSITPFLIIENARKAIEFYKKVFAAKVVMQMERPDGKVAHAELKMGDSKVMLAEECAEMNALSPRKYNGSAVSIHLYIKNVDDVVNKAVESGAKLIRPVETMFYGDRNGTLEDPYGHIWTVSTHVEDVSPAQLRKRAEELYKSKSH